jgi:hypothetical protein
MVPAAPFPPVSPPASWVATQAAVPPPDVVVVAGPLVEVDVPEPPVVVVAGGRVDVVVPVDEGPDEQAAARTAITSTPAAAITRAIVRGMGSSIGVRAIR